MIQNHRNKAMIVASLLIAACAVSPAVVGEQVPQVSGKVCKFLRKVPKDFFKRYLRASKEISSEMWVEKDFYDCNVEGTILMKGKVYRYRVNSSGAGAMWQSENESRTAKHYACDSHCRASIPWPIGPDDE